MRERQLTVTASSPTLPQQASSLERDAVIRGIRLVQKQIARASTSEHRALAVVLSELAQRLGRLEAEQAA